MTAINLNDQIKKIIDTWYAKFPEKFNDNRSILKWAKEFPAAKLITIVNNKSSAKIKQEFLKIYEKDMLIHVNNLKNYEKDVIFRQSTLLAQLGKTNLRADVIEKKIKELEIKNKELARG